MTTTKLQWTVKLLGIAPECIVFFAPFDGEWNIKWTNFAGGDRPGRPRVGQWLLGCKENEQQTAWRSFISLGEITREAFEQVGLTCSFENRLI